jgi:hypothetical protein
MDKGKTLDKKDRGEVLATSIIRVSFFVHVVLSVLAILPSVFLPRESVTGLKRRAEHKPEDELSIRALLRLMLDTRYREATLIWG